MNHQEAVMLCGYVVACTGQKLNDLTPQAWADVLQDLPLPIAKAAVRECVRQRPYPVAPADVLKMATRLRRLTSGDAERRIDAERGEPPADVEEYLAELRLRGRLRRQYADQAIMSGEYDPHLLQIEAA